MVKQEGLVTFFGEIYLYSRITGHRFKFNTLNNVLKSWINTGGTFHLMIQFCGKLQEINMHDIK